MLKKLLIKIILLFIIFIQQGFSQVIIKGGVYDEYLETFYNAKIVCGKTYVTSDTQGNFSINLKGNYPKVITISSPGFITETVVVKTKGQEINVILRQSLVIDQVIIAASRTPERIIESPSTIRNLNFSDFKKGASNTFLGNTFNLNEISPRRNSYTNQTFNTRGFAGLTNSRLVTLVNGMDIATPALNFSQGNLGGLVDLDIKSIEILPGASSALYGANAYNGIVVVNTKNPFDYSGISVNLTSGVTSQKTAGVKPLYDFSSRFAHKFSESLAAKVNFQIISNEGWHANDNRNVDLFTKEVNDNSLNIYKSNYNGVNVYGDELFVPLSSNIQNFFVPKTKGFIKPNTIFTRKGYAEKDLIGKNGYHEKNIRLSAGIFFRPFTNKDYEIELATSLSLTDNITQSVSRYLQRDYYFEQSKLEFKGKDFFVRGYYTRNNADKIYDIVKAGVLLNKYKKQGLDPFDIRLFQLFGKLGEQKWEKGQPVSQTASNIEKAFNENNKKFGKLKLGTPEFKKELERIITTPINDSLGGTVITDRSRYVHADANYNFKRLLNNWADVQIGGSYRKYGTDSEGTVFNDAQESIQVEEIGGYAQIQKKFLDDRLKFTGSIRYDKTQNFKENFSPRLAVNYGIGERKNHVLRASYQTGFRNPTMQEQYLNLNAGNQTIIGSLSSNLDRIKLKNDLQVGTNLIFSLGDKFTDKEDILNNAIIAKSYSSYDQELKSKSKTIVKSDYKEVISESVQTFEIGYRSMFVLNSTTNIDVDFNAFYNRHKDFIHYQNLVVPIFGKIFPDGNKKYTDQEIKNDKNDNAYNAEGIKVADQEANAALFYGLDDTVRRIKFLTNAKSIVNSYGFALGLSTKFLKNFEIALNYNFMDYNKENKDYDFEPNFNTPKHAVRFQFGNEKLLKNFGFNIAGRWTDKYKWVSPFVSGYIDSRIVVDGQLNYNIPSLKSKIKIGGTNLFGQEYYIAPAAGAVGNTYYISWIINQ